MKRMITKQMRDSFDDLFIGGFSKCNMSFSNRLKPLWSEHNYPAICMCSNGNWFGLRKAVKPMYVDEWKGKEVWIHKDDGEFLKYGENKEGKDIELMFEVRPKKQRILILRRTIK